MTLSTLGRNLDDFFLRFRALERFGIFYAHIALGSAFLSAVVDCLGLWGPPSHRAISWETLHISCATQWSEFVYAEGYSTGNRPDCDGSRIGSGNCVNPGSLAAMDRHTMAISSASSRRWIIRSSPHLLEFYYWLCTKRVARRDPKPRRIDLLQSNRTSSDRGIT